MNRDSQQTDHFSPRQRASPPPQPTQYVVHHDFTGATELTTTLVHAISDVTGIDVTDTEFTLYDYVDPEALNQLFRPKADGSLRATGYYWFTIWGCQVTVLSNGQITIVPVAEGASSGAGQQV